SRRGKALGGERVGQPGDVAAGCRHRLCCARCRTYLVRSWLSLALLARAAPLVPVPIPPHSPPYFPCVEIALASLFGRAKCLALITPGASIPCSALSLDLPRRPAGPFSPRPQRPR